MVEAGTAPGQPGVGIASGLRYPARYSAPQHLILPQLVMRYWEPVPRGPVLWEARAEPWATWVPLLCFVLHVISWLLIFSILLVFDYAELMGLKQVRLPDSYLRPMIPSRMPFSLPGISGPSPMLFQLPLQLPHLPPFFIKRSPLSSPLKA